MKITFCFGELFFFVKNFTDLILCANFVTSINQQKMMKTVMKKFEPFEFILKFAEEEIEASVIEVEGCDTEIQYVTNIRGGVVNGIFYGKFVKDWDVPRAERVEYNTPTEGYIVCPVDEFKKVIQEQLDNGPVGRNKVKIPGEMKNEKHFLHEVVELKLKLGN